MGMFDKDKLYGGTPLENWIQRDTEFILYGARIATRDFPLDDKDDDGNPKTATKSELFVATMEDPENVMKVSTLSSVTAEKVEDAEESDFPAVCMFQEVPSSQSAWSNAKVVKFVREFEGGQIEFDPDTITDAPQMHSESPVTA